jgi:hypothetical protein
MSVTTRPCRQVLRLLPLLVLLVWLGRAGSAQATEVGNARPFGIGFAVGDPTSLVAKVFTRPGNAIDFGLSFRRWGWGHCWRGRDWCDRVSALGLAADYLWQMNIVHDRVDLDWHVGIGGRLWFFDYDDRVDDDDDFGLGVRVPIGLDLTFASPDFLEVFVEITPVMFVVPYTDLEFEAALGVRFYF